LINVTGVVFSLYYTWQEQAYKDKNVLKNVAFNVPIGEKLDCQKKSGDIMESTSDALLPPLTNVSSLSTAENLYLMCKVCTILPTRGIHLLPVPCRSCVLHM